ncbi:DUF4352 domain-containing protein [Niallia sp. NCCP-28]|uniref:DUF4352 domain-containing protein n=1 Tax=Niallia sp. NCCP-28 TaxID=2934712 RepID=UPI002083F548|nr:DUF4352 domain-containing protein [Niallia sp. NCCP-28]GKU84589.1 hypothetical protein NCCP28_39850 [Niallia sp. NCCP-28]
MKKMLTLIFICLFLLSGCSSYKEDNYLLSEVSSAKSNSAKTTTPAYYKDYPANPQVIDDRTLVMPGQTIRSNKGEATLKKITNVNNLHKTEAVELKILEAKLIDYKPDYSLTDFYHSYTHDEQFTFIKFLVEVKNTSDEIRYFAPTAYLKTDIGEQITWDQDIYLENVNNPLKPNETRKGALGFILKKSNINSVKIKTSDVFNEKHIKLADAKSIDLSF